MWIDRKTFRNYLYSPFSALFYLILYAIYTYIYTATFLQRSLLLSFSIRNKLHKQCNLRRIRISIIS